MRLEHIRQFEENIYVMQKLGMNVDDEIEKLGDYIFEYNKNNKIKYSYK